jgi:hypothetical protein
MLHFLTHFALDGAACDPSAGGFLAFPRWYQYLPGVKDAAGGCLPQITALTDIWLVVAAIIDILLRFASILAVGIIIYGGVKFIMSQGEPDQTKQARETIFNALIGLAIAVAASFVVSFVAGQFKGGP